MGAGSQASLELIIALKDQASDGMDKLAGKGNLLSNALSFAAGGAILGGVQAIAGEVGNFFKSSIEESQGWNAAMAQTDAVLKSTGGSAGVTKQQVEGLAASLSSASGLSKFADDAVASGQNLLLTFTGIGKDVFPQATQTMLDMAQAMGGDMKGTAIQLGKALNDPAQGLSALTRVGVTFTQQQEDQIKAMVKAGDTAGAQKVMLAELSREFGGSAKAAADAAGPMFQLGAKFDDIKQTVGDALLPVVNQLAGSFGDLLTGAMPGLTAALANLGPIVQNVSNFLGPILAGSLERSGQMIGFVVGKVGELIGWFQQMAGSGISETLFNMGESLSGVSAPLGALFQVFSDIAGAVQTFISQVQGGTGIFEAFGNVLSAQGPTILENIGGLFGSILQSVGDALPVIVAKLGEWAGAFIAWIGPMIPPMLEKLGQLAEGLWNWLTGTALPTIITKLGEWGVAFVNWIGPMIPPFLAKLGEMAGQFIGWIGTQAAPLLAKLGDWAKSFIDWIVPATVNFLKEWPGFLSKFLDWIGAAAGPLLLKLGDWALKFIGWIAPMIPPFLLALAGIAVAISVFVVETAATLVLKLAEWAGAFLGWIAKDVLPQIPGKLMFLWFELQRFMSDTWPKIVEKLKEWAGAFLGWVEKDVIPFLYGKVMFVWFEIQKFFKDTVPKIIAEAGKIGSGIVDGILQGLKDTWNNIMAWLGEKIAALPQFIKDFLGITSPSKVFAVQVGEPIGQGILVGVQRGLAPLGPTIIANINHALDQAAGEWGRVSRKFGDVGLGDIPRLGGDSDYLGGVTGGGGTDFLSGVMGNYRGSGGGGVRAQNVGLPGGPNREGGLYIAPGAIVINAGLGADATVIADKLASVLNQSAYRRSAGRNRPAAAAVRGWSG